jgi:predicted nucleic acid-binding protein
MRQEFEIIISDTSCLILLYKIKELELLRKFELPVCITPQIKNEFGLELPEWIQVKSPVDNRFTNVFEMEVDPGEASAIALSFENENSILIVDDLKARKLASRLQLRYTGTLGLILNLKQSGKVNKIKPIIEKIRLTNFRISDSLLDSVLNDAEEL